ncbi:DNA-binding response regulator [Flavobacterium sp. JP2137]|uniref:DNA-binding response regulator n=1 Tax=Flavobacterium sp. JP2137 TaxID=3414510 RepID=UPI003D30099E
MNILIVDDHPLTVEGYHFSLSKHPFFQNNTIFSKAYDCESAYHLIHKSIERQLPFDLAVIDLGLPPFEEKNLKDGTYLARHIMEILPDCKIAIITAHTEIIIIYDIIKNTRPHALIVKNDITPHNLPLLLNDILEGKQVQSETVKKCSQEIWKKELMLDDNNRLILLYLSKGNKLNDLHLLIPLAPATLKKRINKMKEAFSVSDTNCLIQEAFKQGFV